MNPELPDDVLQSVKEALHRGNKIEAIRLYRSATHGGLAEAKSAVEHLEGGQRIQSPASFQPSAQPQGAVGIGCAILVVALVVIVLVVMWFLEGRHGGKAAELRYSKAFGIIMTVWVTLQGCALSVNPRRRTAGVLMLFAALILMLVSVYLTLQPPIAP